MDIDKMLAELRSERDQLEQAMIVLARLELSKHKRRGRPPSLNSLLKSAGRKRRGRPPGSKNKAKAQASR